MVAQVTIAQVTAIAAAAALVMIQVKMRVTEKMTMTMRKGEKQPKQRKLANWPSPLMTYREY